MPKPQASQVSPVGKRVAGEIYSRAGLWHAAASFAKVGAHSGVILPNDDILFAMFAPEWVGFWGERAELTIFVGLGIKRLVSIGHLQAVVGAEDNYFTQAGPLGANPSHDT